MAKSFLRSETVRREILASIEADIAKLSTMTPREVCKLLHAEGRTVDPKNQPRVDAYLARRREARKNNHGSKPIP